MTVLTVERVEQFIRTPMNELPTLLKQLIAKTCCSYGVSGEVYYECFLAYAVIIETTKGGNPMDTLRDILADLIKSPPTPSNLNG